MCFKIGKQVAVIEDTLKGTVVGVNNQIIYVEDVDGMVYQFHKNELILLEKRQDQFSEYKKMDGSFLKNERCAQESRSPIFRKHKKKMILEVDLHLNQLVENPKEIHTFEILSLQLKVAKRKIEFALEKRIPKIIFIHGMGAGILKSELHNLLRIYMLKFYDAPYKKYGLGATEVEISQRIPS